MASSFLHCSALPFTKQTVCSQVKKITCDPYRDLNDHTASTQEEMEYVLASAYGALFRETITALISVRLL